jgi:hypothetical protein
MRCATTRNGSALGELPTAGKEKPYHDDPASADDCCEPEHVDRDAEERRTLPGKRLCDRRRTCRPAKEAHARTDTKAGLQAGDAGDLVFAISGLQGTFGVGRENDPVGLRSTVPGPRNVADALAPSIVGARADASSAAPTMTCQTRANSAVSRCPGRRFDHDERFPQFARAEPACGSGPGASRAGVKL